MNIACGSCRTVYRVDPARVPAGGVRARCSACGATFPVSLHAAPAAAAAIHAGGESASVAAPASAYSTVAASSATAQASAAAQPAAGATSPAGPPRPRFGNQDPEARARRIARALVSDIVAYYPDRHEKALEQGTLRVEFKDEILKSWNEYVEQVGEGAARGSSHFRDALNDVLARGEKVF